MADTLVRTHPLEARRAAFAALSAELAPAPVDLTIELAPMAGAVDLRVDPAVVGPAVVDPAVVGPAVVGTAVVDLAVVGPAVVEPAVLGGPLPTRPNTWTALADGGRAIWLGPDEWLLTGEWAGHDREDVLRGVVAPLGGAAVDVSDQRTGLCLRGSGARELLAFGCALDLRPASFPPGSCAQTLLGEAGVLLVAHPEGLDVLVRTSFAGYVADWLLDAATELRPTDQPHTDQPRAEA